MGKGRKEVDDESRINYYILLRIVKKMLTWSALQGVCLM